MPNKSQSPHSKFQTAMVFNLVLVIGSFRFSGSGIVVDYGMGVFHSIDDYTNEQADGK